MSQPFVITRRQALAQVRKHLPSALVVARVHADRRRVSRSRRKVTDRALADER